MMTIEYFFAYSCISCVVGPSGIFSTESYQRVDCSAQKYGPVKISCMQMICTPAAPASSMYFSVFSSCASRILSSGSSELPASDV